jgi:uncharacterized protein (DUF1015 family)
MAIIRPFHGLRYTPGAGSIETLVAPPYDVIGPEEREVLAANAHNVVLLTLPEQLPDDRSKFVKYARSASRLEEWRRDGVIAREERASFYRLVQWFKVPGSDAVQERTSLIALIKVEPYEKGVVLPHEQTFPKHKEDRLRILEATRAHLESIYGLFEDDDQAAFRLIQGASAERVIDVTTTDGVRHAVDRIDDPETTCAIAGALADKKVWIADGHHRYETAVAFRAQKGHENGLVAEDFMMMALGSMTDPGLALLPTHRILDKVDLSSEEIRTRVAGAFRASPAPNRELMERITKIGAGGQRAFGLALPGGEGLVLEFDGPEALAFGAAGSARLRGLDVTILHEFIFKGLLGLDGIEFFSYTRDPDEAILAVEAGAKATFLMNPPTVDDMRAIALGGEKMPQKSTYYYPKILSGLVVWSLNDFEA